MANEKKIKKNELNDSELDKVAGGKVGFYIVEGGRCPLCGTYCFYDDEMTYADIDGIMQKVCTTCAGGQKKG
ncbi:MAG: hypothetical protein IKP68_04355 [Clostridia bacterium]|nr:hypothetical protein [Clostridia bacterium]